VSYWTDGMNERDQLRALAVENDRLRKGLRQIVDEDYPAEAGDAGTWAAEILANPAVVDWHGEP
jgi:hypothetical protein